MIGFDVNVHRIITVVSEFSQTIFNENISKHKSCSKRGLISLSRLSKT